MRPVIICVLMLVLTAYVVPGDSTSFRIKHRSSGKYIDIAYSSNNAPDGTKINLRSSPSHYHSNWWNFELIFDHWGYLYHVTSGKYMHVESGDIDAADGTKLQIYYTRHWGALFALDAVNYHVIHKGGRFIHPPSGTSQPSDGEELWLWGNVHDGMKFRFVDSANNNDHPVYGEPYMVGKWSRINAVLNAIGKHIISFTFKVGKSMTDSKTTSFKYTWEVSAGVEIKAFSASFSSSLQYMVERTSSFTWTEQITTNTTITVFPGSSVVTWQWVIDVEQNASKGVYQSNLLSDTDSVSTEPDGLQFREA